MAETIAAVEAGRDRRVSEQVLVCVGGCVLRACSVCLCPPCLLCVFVCAFVYMTLNLHLCACAHVCV